MALARDNGRRELPIEAPRGDIVDRDDAKLVTTRRAAVVQIVPASLPKAERELGDDYHAALSAAERARLDAETRSNAFERQLRDDGRRATRAERVEARRLRKAASAATPVPIPPLTGDDTLYRRIGRVLQIRPETVHERVIRGLAEAPYANITIRTDVPRAEFDYMRERPGAVPGRGDHRHVHPRLPARLAGGAAVRDRRRRARARGRAGSSSTTTTCCAVWTARAA